MESPCLDPVSIAIRLGAVARQLVSDEALDLAQRALLLAYDGEPGTKEVHGLLTGQLSRSVNREQVADLLQTQAEPLSLTDVLDRLQRSSGLTRRWRAKPIPRAVRACCC